MGATYRLYSRKRKFIIKNNYEDAANPFTHDHDHHLIKG